MSIIKDIKGMENPFYLGRGILISGFFVRDVILLSINLD